LTFGRRSQAELSQSESLSVRSSSVAVNTKPRQHSANRNMAVVSRQKMPRQKLANFQRDLASCHPVDFDEHAEQMKECYKTEPVRLFTVYIFNYFLCSALVSIIFLAVLFIDYIAHFLVSIKGFDYLILYTLVAYNIYNQK